ncbi:MAG TPA: hypothetical protein VJU86_08665 [Pyrinomonadaceae bacterium]|nr:hypothetical protein [Pyrinomonadaceae bacterium]
MSDYSEEKIFVEPRTSTTLKLIAVLAAFAVTVLVFVGYTMLKKRHAENTAATIAASHPKPEARPSPKALILVDDALLKGGTTTLAGTVRNTSNEELGPLSVELELKRRTGGGVEMRVVDLLPNRLAPQQEGRYSVQLKAQDYGSARVVSLRTAPDAALVAYTTAQGQKRPTERLESKTIVVDKPRLKGGEFLNTPDNPARVP